MKRSADELRRAIGQLLWGPEFRASLRAQHANGERPILVVDLEEPVGEILERLATHDGVGNLVYWWEGGVGVLSLEPGPASAPDEVQPVGKQATLGMLLLLMAQAGIDEMTLVLSPGVAPSASRTVTSTRTRELAVSS